MNTLHITLSRFMYAPHTLGELVLAIFCWMLLGAALAALWVLVETILTPRQEYWNPKHEFTKGFWISWKYIIVFVLVFVVYCVLPMHLPVLDAFLKHLDTIRI